MSPSKFQAWSWPGPFSCLTQSRSGSFTPAPVKMLISGSIVFIFACLFLHVPCLWSYSFTKVSIPFRIVSITLNTVISEESPQDGSIPCGTVASVLPFLSLWTLFARRLCEFFS